MSSPERVCVTLRLNHKLVDPAEVVDASGYDVLLESRSTAQPGDFAEVTCETGFPAESKTYAGLVLWVQPDRRNNRIGIALPDPAPPDFLVRSSGSIREGLRFSCSFPVTVQWDGRTSAVRGRVLNYSRMGFCLTADETLPPGQELRVMWTRGTDQTSMQVTAIPRWSTPQDGLAIAGCNVVRGPLYAMCPVDVDRWMNRQPGRPQTAIRRLSAAPARMFATYRR